MATMLKECIFIVNQLNEEPFLKNLSFPSFEGFSPENLIEVLNEVLAEIDPKHAKNLQGVVLEQNLQEIITLLSILEYEPIQDFRDALTKGLEEKDKVVIYPVLSWLLQNIPALKRKSYLAEFTTEVEVPIHLQKNENIHLLMEKQRELIQAFKHKFEEHENAHPATVAKDEVMADCRRMQNERSHLLKQRDSLQKVLESSVKDPKELMKATRELRLEMQREKEVTLQSRRQEELVAQEQQRLSELDQQTRALPTAEINRKNLRAELQKDVEANSAKVDEKLLELKKMRAKVRLLQAMAETPSIKTQHLTGIKYKIDEANMEINQRHQEMALSQAANEERLNSLREQASLINQKKNAKAREIQERKDRLESAERNLKTMKMDHQGGRREHRDVLDSKRGNLTNKCQELAELKAAHADLQREKRSLKEKEKYVQPLLQILEAEMDKPGPSDAQKILERMVAIKTKGYSQVDKSQMKEMKSMVASQRSKLSDLKEEYRSVRQQCIVLNNHRKASGGKALNKKVLKPAKIEKQLREKKALLDPILIKIEAAIAQLKTFNPPTGEQPPTL